MRLISRIRDMQLAGLQTFKKGLSVGFVPTMGALHVGHRSLIQKARRENDVVIASIFVNPLQFGPKEDFKRYPRTMKADRRMLEEEGVDVLFAPRAQDITPPLIRTSVSVASLQTSLCGPFRPGHFEGVATIVLKLLHLVLPTRAYFGQKDYQQLQIIRQMVQDLHVPVHIVSCPTVRENDGLACSSRNRYLSSSQRHEAVKLYQTLYLGKEIIDQKAMSRPEQLYKRLLPILKTIPGVSIDYLTLVDPETLALLPVIKKPSVLAAAIRIGKTRLIDNIVMS